MKTTQPSGSGVASLSDLGVTATASELNALHGVKRYVALLTQSGTGDPMATVLENSIGAIVWSRTTVGVYKATLVAAFPASKVWTNPPQLEGFLPVALERLNDNELKLAVSEGDDSITNVSVEIRVYP